MSIDRRQFKRFETLLIVEIDPQKEGASYFFGITRNVSFEGFIFESQNYNLQPGDILEFRLKHPKNKLSVPVIGEIVWNRETKFECHSGVRFHRFNNETKSKVFELISADTIELSAHISSGKEMLSETKTNGRIAEPDKKERDDMISDVIAQVAGHNRSSQIGDEGMRKEPSLSVNGTKHGATVNEESIQGDEPGDTAIIGSREHDAQKGEGKYKQKNVSRTASGSIAVKRKGLKKRRQSTLGKAVFFALFLSSGLLIFLSDDVREKIIWPELTGRFVKNIDAVIDDDGDAPETIERFASESAPDPNDQSESTPGDDKQTLEEYALPETGMHLDQEQYEDRADHDDGGAEIRLTELPMTDQGAHVRDRSGLLPEAGEVSAEATVRGKIQAAMVDEEKNAQRDSGDTHQDKANIAASVKKQEGARKNAATVQEESQPAGQPVTGSKTEKVAVFEDNGNLPKATVKERAEIAPKKKYEEPEKISKPEHESVSQKTVALRKPEMVPGDDPLNTEFASVKEKKRTVNLQTAMNAAPGGIVKTGRDVESVQKAEKSTENKLGIKKSSTPVKRIPAETSGTGESLPPIEHAEQAAMHEKPEGSISLSKGKPEMTRRDAVPEQDQSKKASHSDGMPKIALVLRNDRSTFSSVKNKPEMSDEYLKEHFTAYTDPFDDNSNKWDIFDIGAASARIEDGLYHIENRKAGGTLIVLHYQRFPHESDFVIETAITAIQGVEKSSFGFIFGAKDARDNYSFQIRENKYYAVKNYHNGVSGQLITGEIRDLGIHLNTSILLKIIKQDDDIRFYINNRFVTGASNLEFYGSQIGFIVEGRSHIAIDFTRSYVRKANNKRAG